MPNMRGAYPLGMGPLPQRIPAVAGLLLIALQWVGCAAPPQKTTAMVTGFVPGLRPGDLQHCAEEMGRDLVPHPLLQRSDPPVWIGIVSVDNHTNEPFVGGSADMVVQRIQTILHRTCSRESDCAARFVVTRKSLEDAITERKDAQAAGIVTNRGTGSRPAIDCFLSGVYHELAKRDGGVQIVEMLMTFELVDAVTGEVLWTHDYLVKTVTPD